MRELGRMKQEMSGVTGFPDIFDVLRCQISAFLLIKTVKKKNGESRHDGKWWN
jgi:hypothetical protein